MRRSATLGLSLILCAMSACTTVAHPLDTTEWRLVSWTLSSIGPENVAIRASTGDRLTLHDAGGNESLVFEALGR